MHFNNDYRSTNFSPSYMLIFVRADKILSVHKFLKHHGCSPPTAIFYKYGKATMRIFLDCVICGFMSLIIVAIDSFVKFILKKQEVVQMPLEGITRICRP